MIKITIEGPHGTGKSRLAKGMAKWARTYLKNANGFPFLVDVLYSQADKNHVGPRAYDMVITEKQTI